MGDSARNAQILRLKHGSNLKSIHNSADRGIIHTARAKLPMASSSLTKQVQAAASVANQVLSQKEIRNGLASKLASKRIKLTDMFRDLDRNKDGTLTESEMEKGLRGVGIEASKREMNLMLTLTDKNGDGTISYGEFSTAFNLDGASQIQSARSTGTNMYGATIGGVPAILGQSMSSPIGLRRAGERIILGATASNESPRPRFATVITTRGAREAARRRRKGAETEGPGGVEIDSYRSQITYRGRKVTMLEDQGKNHPQPAFSPAELRKRRQDDDRATREKYERKHQVR
jgi:hypothetical protein